MMRYIDHKITFMKNNNCNGWAVFEIDSAKEKLDMLFIEKSISNAARIMIEDFTVENDEITGKLVLTIDWSGVCCEY